MRKEKKQGQGLKGNCSFALTDLSDGDPLAWDATEGKWGIGTAGITDAPSDGTEYVRKNAAWTASSGITDAPSDGTQYARKNAAWEAVSGGGSSLVNTVDNGLAAQLQYDGVAALDTVSGGVEVTGTFDVSGQTFLNATTWQYGSFVLDDLDKNGYSSDLYLRAYYDATTYFEHRMRCGGVGLAKKFEWRTLDTVYGGSARTRMRMDKDGYVNWYYGSGDTEWMKCASSQSVFGAASVGWVTTIQANTIYCKVLGTVRFTVQSDGVVINGKVMNGVKDTMADQWRLYDSCYINGVGTVTMAGNTALKFTAITDMGVGTYRLTCYTTLPASTYIHIAATADDGTTGLTVTFARTSSTTVTIYLFDDTGTLVDGYAHVAMYLSGGN